MKKILILFLFLMLIPSVSANEKVLVEFSSCIDGDTAKFKLNNEIKTTRFLAIETPETKNIKIPEPFGKEASEYTCDRLEKAYQIILEFDKNSDREDKYNRLLAWIWVDDYLLQRELIQKGLGEVAYLYGEYKHTPLLQDDQAVAQANKLGLWGEVPVEETDYITIIYLTLATIICAFIYKKIGIKMDPKKLVKKIKK